MKKPARLALAVPFLAALAAGCGKGGSASSSGPTPTPVTTATGATEQDKKPPMEGIKNGPLSFAPIAKAVDPSVVTIQTIGEEQEPGGLFGRTRRRETKGLGTGFVIDNDGTVLTNNHVIEGATVMTIKLSDDREFPGKVIGRDPRTDIAVVHIEAKDAAKPNLTPLKLGDSDQAEVGDWVVAIGNPFGLSHTVSAGIVSAKGRTNQDVPLDKSGFYNFIQTDASINPGNSGGPLLNLSGEVVGINSAIRGGGAQGIGFAIPINMVKELLPMLMRDGHVTRSALGVIIRDVHDLAPEDKASLKIDGDKGAVVEQVEPGGPADKAGLQAGDVLTDFDGQPIDRGTRLQWLASISGVGKTVTVKVQRQGKPQELKVTLGRLEDVEPKAQRQDAQDPFGAPH
ncbi:MAG TPA: trypsin-like peptidase domain-containing protein [Polyangiaceae bacterium]